MHMKYNKIVEGHFINRPNRFIAKVDIDGTEETVHVKNTGRCKELLIPGVRVYLAESDNLERKTKYDLVTVEKEGIGLFNMDSQAPNAVVYEWLKSNPLPAIPEEITYIKPEYTYGNSRVDFYFECGKEKQKCLLEVKGVTLERDRVAYFPDAPTLRGVKHLQELTHAMAYGYQCYLAFVIQMEGVNMVYPNMETQPAFGKALMEAQKAGVKVLYLGCQVRKDALWIDRVKC